MIHVLNIPAITWTLTALLLLSGSYHLRQAARSPRRTEQINNSIHALMHILMAAMLWQLAPSTVLAQITVLTGAALWFIIQAVARPEFKILCSKGPGRLKCFYHSLSMAGAATMIAMMGQMSTGTGRAPTDAMAGMSMYHGNHAMTGPAKTTPTTIGHSPNLAILLTAVFTAAAITFIILLLRTRATQTTHYNTAAPKISKRADHALEALGAAVMALMFATMMA
ncbi:DUF5134 domain-containing protein [Arthrobacter dokdonensis]|uniref:DUF5134 domain-containing protein n=1 Tax=Arthrobacter dokdonellae TaxID=2211210 RepID=UPI001494BC62|nr:DUF5134 domain-containing protein [Arthrobacter dokdonellae]